VFTRESGLPKEKYLHVRISDEDHELFRRAAKSAGQSLTEFVLTYLRLAAQHKLGEEQPVLVATTVEPPLRLNLNYPPLPEHLYDQVDLRNLSPGDPVRCQGRLFTYRP
jgi:uncharacterized protein (DUF1778 family)